MSDAHLTERQLGDGPEPVDLTDEPIQLSRRDAAALDVEESRRRPVAGGWC